MIRRVATREERADEFRGLISAGKIELRKLKRRRNKNWEIRRLTDAISRWQLQLEDLELLGAA